MSIRKFRKLYRHYQNYYDFTKSNMTYRELEEKQNQVDEWLPD